MHSKKMGAPAVAAYRDHDVITPPNRLERAVRHAGESEDPVARAEAALAKLSSEFSGWMDDECEQLDRVRRDVHKSGMTQVPRAALFRAAHDIKGQAATLGFPLVADVADSLCRLIEHARDPSRIPLALVDQHVDAVRAIIREHGGPQAEALAGRLTCSLRDISAEFLRREGIESAATHDIESPPIAPTA